MTVEQRSTTLSALSLVRRLTIGDLVGCIALRADHVGHRPVLLEPRRHLEHSILTIIVDG
jgi:hypothetical protein